MTNNEFCIMHERNVEAIARHSGQWKLLLWILGLGIGALTTIAGSAFYMQQTSIAAITVSVHNIDKATTAYMASHSAEALDGFRRIENLEVQVNDLDERVHVLENR